MKRHFNLCLALVTCSLATHVHADDPADGMKPSARGASMLDAETLHRSALVEELHKLELKSVEAKISEEDVKIKENTDRVNGRTPGAMAAIPPGMPMLGPPVSAMPVTPLSAPKAPIQEVPNTPTLAGIIGDSAIFSVNGSQQVARAGDTVNGYHVERVTSESVSLTEGSHTVHLPAPVR